MAMRKDDSTVAHLSRSNRRAYEALFRHPAPEDLEWGAVRALLAALAEVQEGRKGILKATRRGVMATFHAARDRQALSAHELYEVQSFLERSNEGVSMPVVAEETQLLVAVEADGARIYRIEMRASVPRGLVPFQANGYAAHLRSSLAQLDRQPQPVRLGFYREVARSLRGAERILLLACGEGGASAMEALRAELERGHGEVSRRVVGALVIKGRCREEQLLARTKEFYAEFAQPPGSNSPGH